MPFDCIALQGCIHGDIDRCYQALHNIKTQEQVNIIGLLWSGDVQTTRHEDDLRSMACPAKYKKLKDFHNYYAGIARAPCLTIFIGGNHEASEFLLDIHFGGWVAPNIYYFGRSGVLWINGFRICGLSGIYNQRDINRGYYETAPLNASSIRSVYHVRQFEIQKLKQLKTPIDMVATHDWPIGIVNEAEDRQRLLKKKPYFRQELESNTLGNPFTQSLLDDLSPTFWVAAHLHVNFNCLTTERNFSTRFLCHNKPGRTVSTSLISLQDKQCQFDVALNEYGKESNMPRELYTVELAVNARLEVDAEWLWILKCSSAQTPYEDRVCNQELKMDASPTWGELKNLASNIDEIIGCNWTEIIRENYPMGVDDYQHCVPRELLIKLRFAIPDWTILDYRDPISQTKWWKRLLDLESERYTPTTSVAPWLANEEEECLSL